MKNILKVMVVAVLLNLLNTTVYAQPTPPAGKQWQAVPELTDEFNSFNSSKWQKGHPYWSGRSPSQFNNSNVTFNSGKLRIRASVKNSNQTGDWIWTGCLTSKNKSFKKGMYAEARIKNADLSIVSSFWMQGNYSEIDVLENWGEVKNSQWSHLDYTMEMNTHYYPKPCGWNCDIKTQKHYTNPGNTGNSAQYATYGVWWENDRTIRFYRNGIQVATATTGGPFNEDMYMFFDMEAFTWGPGLPTINDLNNTGKSTAYYDWVHTYKLVNSSSSSSSGGGTAMHMKKRNSSGFALDGKGGGSNGQNIYLWSSNTNNVNQKWEEINRGGGYYSYKKVNTNYCIDGGNGGANGQNVYLWACSNGNQNQHWKKVDAGSGNYRLEKRNSPGYSIDGGNGGGNGQNVYLWTSNHSNQNQHWKFSSVTKSAGAILEPVSANILQFYPNPASDVLNINLASEIKENARVVVYDTMGKELISGLLTHVNYQLSLANLSSGLYILKVINGSSIISERFIKE